jgi:hypothetical protein
MPWTVEYTDEFEGWWDDLSEDEQGDVAASVGLLERRGPFLGFPHTSDIKGSRHGQLRELRIQHQGEPYRVFYAFDPTRAAILLVGGNKTGDDRFYERMVPIADDIYSTHLKQLAKEPAPTPVAGEPPPTKAGGKKKSKKPKKNPKRT